jgi:signal transduction histidine kinase
MLAVVVSFAASFGYSHFRLRPINQYALEIIEDAVPSIEHLGSVRTELNRLGMFVAEYVARSENGKTVTRDDVRAARDQLDSELAAYRRLPAFPGEDEHLATIDQDLAQLDRSIRLTLDETDAGASSSAVRSLHEVIHPQMLKTYDDLARLRAVNLSRVYANAEGIRRANDEAAFFALALGLTSLLVASLASLLVIRVLRGRARLSEERGRMLVERATELEAFAGRVAHDLKDPLGAIALRVLSAGMNRDLDPKVQDHLDKVTRQVDRMDRIINGLLEFARAGANPPPGARADLENVLSEIVSEVSPAANAAQTELKVDPFPPTQLACTPGALTSVLSNLLGNAVKYIPGGEQPRRIAVHVREGGDYARVEVEDNGPGLPPGTEQMVFEPFRRLAGSKAPGIGLGLATVKKIVEAYRGRVGVDSHPGRGSIFWFEMPKAPPGEGLVFSG